MSFFFSPFCPLCANSFLDLCPRSRQTPPLSSTSSCWELTRALTWPSRRPFCLFLFIVLLPPQSSSFCLSSLGSWTFLLYFLETSCVCVFTLSLLWIQDTCYKLVLCVCVRERERERIGGFACGRAVDRDENSVRIVCRSHRNARNVWASRVWVAVWNLYSSIYTYLGMHCACCVSQQDLTSSCILACNTDNIYCPN